MLLPRSVLLLCVLCSTAFAQENWTPAPLPATTSGPVGPLPSDPLTTGVQFHAEIQGGPNGFGPSASVGVGFNRVAILLTPALQIGSGTNLVSLAIAARIYFRKRVEGALLGFIRPELMVGSTGTQFLGAGTIFGGIGVGGGGEYLLTRNLGFTAELGLRYLSSTQSLTTIFSLGIMLHT